MTVSKMHMALPTVRLQALQNDLSWTVWKLSSTEKKQENRRRKVTEDVEARICAIVCSAPLEGASRWIMQAIADELIRLEVVDYITDTTVYEVMKKTRSNCGL